jgi:hypothetical protein
VNPHAEFIERQAHSDAVQNGCCIEPSACWMPKYQIAADHSQQEYAVV